MKSINTQATNLVIHASECLADGEVIDTSDALHMVVKLIGDTGFVECQQSLVINGDVQGDIQCQGKVLCEDVEGDIKANGKVQCENVEGDLHEKALPFKDTFHDDMPKEDFCNLVIKLNNDEAVIQSSIALYIKGDVLDDVKSEGMVQCEDVEGDIFTSGSVQCEDVEGDIFSGAEIICNS